jgi:putative serine protease PepD
VATGTLSRPTVTRIWTVALLAGVVGALVASGVGVIVGSFDPHTTTVVTAEARMTIPTLDSVPLASASSSAPGWPAIADAVAYSVAAVTVAGPGGARVGSGVVDASGGGRTYLLTDAGLVEQGGALTVTFNGSAPQHAYLVQSDPKTGLALLWVYGETHIAPQVGSVGSVYDAEQVMAVGARASDMAATVPGSVSSTDRTVDDSNSSYSLTGLLAVSPSMPAGDAGGAIVDAQGLVIGIATSVTSVQPEDSGLTFAVPIDLAQHVAAQMLASKQPTHPWLGVVESADLDSATAARMGIPGGAEVVSVAPGSPLAQAHVQPQDVITSFDGRSVTSSGGLVALLDRCAPGDVAAVGYRQGSRATTARVRVTEQPADIDGD